MRTLDQDLVIILFIVGGCAIFLLPSIVAIFSRNRYWWAIIIANLFVPASPLTWITLLFAAMQGRGPRYRR